ncbi:hypothetical protein E4U42_006650 [Claviceps africana]|uniref:DASH complex subunit DAM1 n=1 Tax=Claviceps africana TaxID=83212 RepID=A0A8K0NJT0_9HYPO|nr:hypothetical protein E4U42_006650 [Claviceps africana]
MSNMQDFGASHRGGSSRGQKRSNSQTRHSRPTTPLRPSSRSSFRDSARDAGKNAPSFPLNTFEPAFAELSDAVADLEANMMHFQLMHESLSRFSESFASFLYGMNVNAYCVDFLEGPITDSFGRNRRPETPCETSSGLGTEAEATFIIEQSLHLPKIDNPASHSPEGRQPQAREVEVQEVEEPDYWAAEGGLSYEAVVNAGS